MKEINTCEVCKKESEFARFESSFDGIICDSCLEKMKEEDRHADDTKILEIENLIPDNMGDEIKSEIKVILRYHGQIYSGCLSELSLGDEE